MKRSDWIGIAILAAILLAPMAVSAAVKRTPFAKWGKRFGVSPQTLKKIAQHESRMDPKASRNIGGDATRGGAWGLMQVTLATAEHLAGRMPTDNDIQVNLQIFDLDPIAALYTPNVNVMFGAFYFSGLLKRFGGDELAAIGAYNRGARGMSDLIASGTAPGELQYVQRVLAA